MGVADGRVFDEVYWRKHMGIESTGAYACANYSLSVNICVKYVARNLLFYKVYF